MERGKELKPKEKEKDKNDNERRLISRSFFLRAELPLRCNSKLQEKG